MIVKKISEVRKKVKEAKKQGFSVGFVPTMGYLHDGHLSLIKKAKEENDFVVVSIFVNPIQFGPNEDLDKYPRDIIRDTEVAEKGGCDLIFNPEVDEIFPEPLKTSVEVTGLTEPLCGRSRPGHFKGVTTIVSKLFNIVAPDKAYFGQKDAQQAAVLIKMTKDLNFDIEITVCPIVREVDGLAMSSRNVYLNSEERKNALSLIKSLEMAEEIIEAGEREVDQVTDIMKKMIESHPGCQVDYIEILDFENMEEIKEIKGKVLIALAVRLGKTRLIDNKILEVE
jgi:pantoate--beta-alanine ligase